MKRTKYTYWDSAGNLHSGYSVAKKPISYINSFLYFDKLGFFGNNVARELLERVDSKTDTMTQSASL